MYNDIWGSHNNIFKRECTPIKISAAGPRKPGNARSILIVCPRVTGGGQRTSTCPVAQNNEDQCKSQLLAIEQSNKDSTVGMF